jgi:hypothetical protein
MTKFETTPITEWRTNRLSARVTLCLPEAAVSIFSVLRPVVIFRSPSDTSMCTNF